MRWGSNFKRVISENVSVKVSSTPWQNTPRWIPHNTFDESTLVEEIVRFYRNPLPEITSNKIYVSLCRHSDTMSSWIDSNWHFVDLTAHYLHESSIKGPTIMHHVSILLSKVQSSSKSVVKAPCYIHEQQTRNALVFVAVEVSYIHWSFDIFL